MHARSPTFSSPVSVVTAPLPPSPTKRTNQNYACVDSCSPPVVLLELHAKPRLLLLPVVVAAAAAAVGLLLLLLLLLGLCRAVGVRRRPCWSNGVRRWEGEGEGGREGGRWMVGKAGRQ